MFKQHLKYEQSERIHAWNLSRILLPKGLKINILGIFYIKMYEMYILKYLTLIVGWFELALGQENWVHLIIPGLINLFSRKNGGKQK